MLWKKSIQSHNGRKLGIGLDASKLFFKISAAMIFLLLPAFSAASKRPCVNCAAINIYVREGDSFDLDCCEFDVEPSSSRRMYFLESPNVKYIVDEGSAHEKEEIRASGIQNNQDYLLDEESAAHEKERIETFPDSSKCGLRVKNFSIADKGPWICKSHVRKDGNLDAFIKTVTTHPDSESQFGAYTIYSNVHDVQFTDLSIPIGSFCICILALPVWTWNTNYPNVGYRILHFLFLSFSTTLSWLLMTGNVAATEPFLRALSWLYII